jgi:heat shock protein HslJ
MRTPLLLLFAFWMNTTVAQQLKPGFDLQEYTELLKVGRSFVDSMIPGLDIPHSTRYRRVYRSPVMGLENMWELHTDDQGTAVISLRGTTAKAVSWLANGYAAMIPATGSMQLEKGFTFEHHLANDPEAAVHVGWTVGVGFLQRDILPKVDSLYKAGVRDVIITGHSQGGALAYLLTAHLWDLRTRGRLPADLRLKTYASAAPKPGNLFFAHHFESTTRGWAFNLVNAWDWVPETPMSIQTVDDFNTINPFTDGKKAMKDLPLTQRVVARHVYNKLDKPTRKAQRNYQHYLGGSASGFVRKSLPDFVPPAYAATNNYARTGTIITLMPDSAYSTRFPQQHERMFVNHMPDAYLFLAERSMRTVLAISTPTPAPQHDTLVLDRQRDVLRGMEFHAAGDGWLLTVHAQQGFVLDRVGMERLVFPYTAPIKEQDGGYRYVSTIESVRIAVVVSDTVNAVPGTFPTTVRIGSVDAAQTYTWLYGTGEFLPSVRLHDIWMLMTIDGKRVDPKLFREGPRLEFFVADGQVVGSDGCNGISGPFTATPEGLFLGALMRTLVACPGAVERVEQAFHNALGSGPLRYTFHNNDLTLRAANGTVLVFRRVD